MFNRVNEMVQDQLSEVQEHDNSIDFNHESFRQLQNYTWNWRRVFSKSKCWLISYWDSTTVPDVAWQSQNQSDRTWTMRQNEIMMDSSKVCHFSTGKLTTENKASINGASLTDIGLTLFLMCGSFLDRDFPRWTLYWNVIISSW